MTETEQKEFTALRALKRRRAPTVAVGQLGKAQQQARQLENAFRLAKHAGRRPWLNGLSHP